MQIVVFGMHRSGTSAMTRLINMMGAWFGGEGASVGFNEYNAKGFWERRDVMSINMQLLGARDCNWFEVTRWPAYDPPALDPRLVQAMKALVLELDAHRPWVMKDPRLCITFPDWREHLEVPVAVIAARDPLEVARSLEQREGVPISLGMAVWEHYAVHIARNAVALPKAFVSHERLMAAPVETTRRLYDELVALDVRRLALPSDREVLAFIEPKLHRARAADVDAALTPHQLRLHAMLRGEAAFDPAIEASAESRAVIEREGPALRARIAAVAAARKAAR